MSYPRSLLSLLALLAHCARPPTGPTAPAPTPALPPVAPPATTASPALPSVLTARHEAPVTVPAAGLTLAFTARAERCYRRTYLAISASAPATGSAPALALHLTDNTSGTTTTSVPECFEAMLEAPAGGVCTVRLSTGWDRCDARAFTLRVDNATGAPVPATLTFDVMDPRE